MRVTTASRKKRSCDTRMTACGYAVQVLLEPVARLEIEMVGRLVEQQQVRLAEQQLGQREAHLPAAGERVGRPLEIRRLEAEPLQDRRGLQLDAVAVADA